MGRPRLDIDEVALENYARLGATNTEIAAIFGCDEGTIRKRFSATLAKGRGNRKVKLRELQWKAANDGNVTMLIWLGKNELKQSDAPQTEDAATLIQMARALVQAKPPSGSVPSVDEPQAIPDDSRGPAVG